MQIFLPYSSPFLTAKILDKKRLNKQIIECKQIIKAIKGESNAWKNHPVVLMYKNHLDWLNYYMKSLFFYKNGDTISSFLYSKLADNIIPEFICEVYCNNFKKRLYTKDPIKYELFKQYGKSYENWYYVNNNWLVYSQK